MQIGTMLRLLCGSRSSILAIASDQRALVAGFLFVCSAGLAREYDGEDLLHEPWHVLIPLGASTLAAFALWTVVRSAVARRQIQSYAWLGSFPAFLSVFWMTAPLAWLYAIPYERVLSAEFATLVNLWTLAIVSIWRVLLISRALAVLMKCRFVESFFLVMLFADLLAIVASNMLPVPVMAMMGGIRLSTADAMLANTAFMVFTLGMITLPVWLIGSIGVAARWCPGWATADRDVDAISSRWGSAHFAAGGSIILGLCLLPFAQPEQQLRREVQQEIDQGRYAAALATMSAHDVSEFPPHWELSLQRKHFGFGFAEPQLLDILEAMMVESPAPWVRQMLLDRAIMHLHRGRWGNVSHSERVRRELALIVRLVEHFGELQTGLANARRAIEYAMNDDPGECPETAENLRKLLELTAVPVATSQPVAVTSKK